MKLLSNYFYIIVCALLVYESNAQFVATYEVVKTLTAQSADKKSSKTLNYTSTGYFIASNNKYLFYTKPNKEERLMGKDWQVSFSNSERHSYGLFADTLHNINYLNFDSLIYRYRTDASDELLKTNFVRKFEPGYRVWLFSKETKFYKGMKLEKASSFNNKNELVKEVWFTRDIPSKGSPYGLVNLPGLAVEIYSPIFNERAVLSNINFGIKISEEEFWPKQFSLPFKEMSPLRAK